MLLINCKIHLELNWTKDCVMSSIERNTEFKIINTELYVPIVILSTEDNVKLTKHLSEGFKRSVYWNQHKTEMKSRNLDDNNPSRILLASFQGVKRLFVLAFDDTNGDKKVDKSSYRKYFLPRVDITNYNVLIDGINFYDQPIGDQIKKYIEIKKIAAGDDYTTGCLLDYQYFKDHYQLIAFDLSKQKEFNADRRAIQQIEFYEMLDTKSQVCTILEKAKQTILEFYKGTAKVLRILYMVEYSKANVKLSDSQ